MTDVLDRPAAAGADDDGARERQAALRGQYPTLQEQEARQRAIIGELAAIDQIPEPGDDDLGWQGTLIREHDDLDVISAPLRKRAKDMERIRAAHQDPANRESGDGSIRTPDLATRNFIGQDPFRDLERVRMGLVEPKEVRGRALDAIEDVTKHGYLEDQHAENATRMVQSLYGQFGEQSRVAQHILETGSDEYREQFQRYLQNPSGESARTALSLTNVNGGYLLPFVLDPTIILTNAGSANPWRRISRVVQTTSNTWNGVNSAGVNAAMIGEAGVSTDVTPTVANIVITPQRANAWIFGSYEVLEDTDFGQQLPRLLADAKDRLEENQFAVGNNTPPNTQGIIPAATTVYTTATTTVIALGDVYGVQGALPARFRNAPKCAWVANVAIINKFRQLDTAGGASFWTNLGKGQPETLLGAPIYESTSMTASVATTSLMAIMGDFEQYIICDRVGVSMIYEPLVKDQATLRPTGQAGWYMFWRFGAQLSTANAFRVMKGL
jgi:HK97 family phage major capsid protein